MKGMKKFLSLLLCMMMVIGMLPMSAFADETESTDTLAAALNEAKTYIDALTINNSSNDPETVVKNFKTHFTWDNEKRENSKGTLFDWSYYNGVVFEGLEYLYENTNDEAYKSYVLEYMSSLIASDGTWATCSNDSSKTCSGYDGTHGGDTIKTASLLLDAYEMSGDSRYLTMAAAIYADITEAVGTYSLTDAGNNLRHTWATYNGTDYKLWLDGLYMVLPFRSEYAAYIVNNPAEFTTEEVAAAEAELDLIVDRLQWVSDNMYDSSKGWFYHAANSATSNSGSYWLRSMGWYAAAIVDVMDSYAEDSDNFKALQAQLVKLLAGMKACQNSTNGMWLNNPNIDEATKNPYETSGTSLICYAAMKAYNNGWVDSSYADMAVLAFEGICNNKLENNNLTDICFKGAPSSSTSANSTFYDNEGKGVGPFIMLYAETLEYYNNEILSIEVNTSPDKTTYTIGETLDITGLTVYGVQRDGDKVDLTDKIEMDPIVLDEAGTQSISVTYNGMTATFEVTVEDVPVVDNNVTAKVEGTDAVVEAVVIPTTKVAEKVASVLDTNKLVAYDISVEGFEEGQTAEVTIPMPENVDATKFMVWYVGDDDTLEPMNGHPNADDWTYTFTTTHFSVYVGGEIMLADAGDESVSGTGALAAGKVYTLNTDGVIDTTKTYLIASGNSGNVSVLTNNNGTADGTTYAVTNNTITVTDDSNIAWTLSGTTSGTIYNDGTYIRLGSSGVLGNYRSLTISSQGGGAYCISYRSSNGMWNTTYYLGYNNGDWSRSESTSNVYLYEYTSSSAGEAVTFTATPGSATIAPEGTLQLNGTVTVAGETVDLSDCTITWASSDTSRATVSNGTVTGVADGTANITATLSAVNGTALQKNIVLTIPVTVASKQVVSATLTGNAPITISKGSKPDLSNLELTVTYDEGEPEIITIGNGLTVTGYNISEVGSYKAEITYNGTLYGYVTINVVDPEYPADGAVRINKTATEGAFDTTGVVKVELDVAGVSVKSAIDVILVTDLSNSMAWKAGGRTDAGTYADTKMADLAESVSTFADTFLGDGTSNHTISLVTFGGYDAEYTKNTYNDYADPTQTLVLGTKDPSVVKTSIDNIKILADDALSLGTSTTGYYLSFDGGSTYGENYGNTNYDHAFMQTSSAIDALKAQYKTATGTDYANSGREIYVLFMTDGAPSNYDGVYYNYKTGNRADVDSTWINEDGDEVTYTMGINNAQYQAGPWYQYIAGGTYDSDTGTIPGNPLYWADKVYNTDGVVDMFSIGFDIDNGGFSSMTFTEDDGRPLAKVLEKLITAKPLDVYEADDAAGLKTVYENLAAELKLAGTEAVAYDTIGTNFTLQTKSTFTTSTGDKENLSDYDQTPVITVGTYDLWTKAETSDVNLIGTRKRINPETDEVETDPTVKDYNTFEYVFTPIETVTFNADGTEAYSSELEGNIMSADGKTIAAKTFTYTNVNGVETFTWNIGDITDKEITLSFFAYLKGALEGEKPSQKYYTNKEATLEYIDIFGDEASKTFPLPGVVWQGAGTAYEFYLVNAEGKPCDRNGNEIPFANRIVITGPYYEEIYLNGKDENVAVEIVASKVLPAGYTLFDESAYYEVITASGESEGKLTLYGNATMLVSADAPSYVQSHVAFGVWYNLIPDELDFHLTPNTVVIDYGKPIDIDIQDNSQDLVNEEKDRNYKSELVGFCLYTDNTDLETSYSNIAYSAPYETKYGTFSIKDGANSIVTYTPTDTVDDVEKVFGVIKVTNNTNANDWFYMVDKITVIPATSVYYETDFAGGVFDYKTTVTENNVTTVVDTWETATEGPAADGPQDDGTVGEGHYGFDSSYENDTHLSNGASDFVIGQGVKLNDSTTNYTYVDFDFTGTGFDLISRTGAQQGAIRVNIYSDAARTKQVKSITVLNKSESNLELYQIPVVSVHDLSADPAHYYVRVHVNAAYTNTTYPTLNRGGEFYFDAIRVYDPVDQDATDVKDAYLADGEYNYALEEVRNLLIKAETFDATETETDEGVSNTGIVFIDRTQAGVELATYSTIGPNNEVYLSKGQAIAFKMTATTAPASIDIGAKSITGATANLAAIITDTATAATSVKEIKSSTAQNIDLMEYIAVDSNNNSAIADGNAYVIITNTGDGVLSITDIKVAYGNATAASGIDFSVDANTLDVAFACLSLDPVVDTPEEPEDTTPEVPEEIVPEEPEYVPNYDILAAQFDSTKTRLLKSTTMTVVTTQDVESVTVTDKYGMDKHTVTTGYVDNADGTRTWTVTVRPIMIGKQTYTVTGAGADGTTGASATAKINVKLF